MTFRAAVCAVAFVGTVLVCGAAGCSRQTEGDADPPLPRAPSAPVADGKSRGDTGGAAPTAASAPGAVAPAAPASKRLLGRWEMKLNDAPKEALAKDFRRFKQSKELADMVHVEYTVTDTDWVLRKYGAGGVYEEKWKYQVLQENGDALLLERVGEDGQPQRIQVKVGTDTLVVGTGGGMVPLRRMQ